ncbi:MAG: hypothetical protein V8Q75_06405 [Bacilli bacterium]
MKKAPKYIQLCITRMFYHQRVVKNNSLIVEQWLLNNQIDRNVPLKKFLENNAVVKKAHTIAKGQLSIFDFEI